MAGYLTATGAVKGQLVANLSFWIAGVLMLGVAGNIMASLCLRRRALGQVALVCIMTGVPLAIVAFIAMLVMVVQIAPDTSATSIAVANVVGWVGARADDLATVLIIGATPFFLALAGRAEWMPTWLVRWGYLTGLVGLFALIVLYIPSLATFGFAIVPAGMGWMIAAGIALLRRGAAQKNKVGVGLASASGEAV